MSGRPTQRQAPDETGTLAFATALAAFACRLDERAIPKSTFCSARRSFLNWIGCSFSAAGHLAVDAALGAADDMGTQRNTMVIGRGRLTDMQHAALINTMTSSILAFDDTHIHTVTHPTGPIAGALLAYAEHNAVSGRDFLIALILGMEVECRLSSALARPPSECNVGWYLTGITGAAGAAAAIGRAMNLPEEAMVRALGIGALQGAGFRQSHGSMCLGFVPGHAARAGVLAAHMARRGFTCPAMIFEGTNGFFDVFGIRPDRQALVEGLGETFEVDRNLCKPYPAGIFIHASIDACLEILRKHAFSLEDVKEVDLVVHPLGVGLTGRAAPADGFEALVSIYHWVAATLVTGRAGVAEVSDECVRDPRVLAMRNKVRAVPDVNVARDEARATITLKDGRQLSAHVAHARGGPDRPLNDEDVATKFMAQAIAHIPAAQAEKVVRLVYALDDIDDMRTLIPVLAQGTGT